MENYFPPRNHPSLHLCNTNKDRRITHTHTHNQHPVAPWSNLPSQLIQNISKHLTTKPDIKTFRQVCRRWRKYSVTPPPTTFSLLLPLPIPSSYTLPFYQSTPLVLQVSFIYLITPRQPKNKKTGPSSSFSSPVYLNPWLVMAGESTPGRIAFHHPLTGKRVMYYPPYGLDLTQYHVTKISEGYSFKHSQSLYKVLLCSTSSTSTGSVEILVLYDKGLLGKLTLGKNSYYHQWNSRLRGCRGRSFAFKYLDDVVSFKGSFYGVDRKGRLYMLDHKEMRVEKLIIASQLCIGEKGTKRRKRLVVDHVLGDLYLVLRVHVPKKARFEVYKYNEFWYRWDEVGGLGFDRVLFVGLNNCFFARPQDFPGCESIGNCIVFAANCFPQYIGIHYPDRVLFGEEDEDVGVYRYGEEDNFRTILLYPEFSPMIWPPPMWFSLKREYIYDDDEETDSRYYSNEGTISCSSDSSLSDRWTCLSVGRTVDKDDAEEARTRSFGEQPHPSVANFNGKIRQSPAEPIALEQTIKKCCSTPLTPSFGESVRVTPSKRKNQDAERDSPEKNALNANSLPVRPLMLEYGENHSSTAMFEGVDIRSDLLPILKSISDKHGSLIGKDTVRNKKILACTLESLAEVVQKLMTNTARSLSDSQADDLESTFSAIQRVGLKVDWLKPVVEKALSIAKSKAKIESAMALDKEKAELEERERRFLAESAKKKKELEEHRAALSIPVAEPIDFDEVIGKELWG